MHWINEGGRFWQQACKHLFVLLDRLLAKNVRHHDETATAKRFHIHFSWEEKQLWQWWYWTKNDCRSATAELRLATVVLHVPKCRSKIRYTGDLRAPQKDLEDHKIRTLGNNFRLSQTTKRLDFIEYDLHLFNNHNLLDHSAQEQIALLATPSSLISTKILCKICGYLLQAAPLNNYLSNWWHIFVNLIIHFAILNLFLNILWAF